MNDPVASSISTVQVVSLLISVFLPILTALITKSTAQPQLKAIVLFALSAITAFGTEFINDENFVWQQALLTTFVSFTIAVAHYFGLWRYTPLAGANSPVARALTG